MVLVRQIELAAIERRALEVVGQDLFHLPSPFRRDAPEPVEEPLVQVRPQLLRHRRIGSVTKEDMCESISVVARKLSAIGTDELLAHKCQEDGADIGPHVRWNQLRDGAAVEQPAFDRGALDHRPFGRREGVEARREQSLERRRDAHAAVGLRSKRDELFDEERIPLGGVEDALARFLIDISRKLGGLLGREWFKHNCVGVRTRPRPGRPRVEQLDAPGAEQQYRRGGEVRDIFHKVEERRFGPVQIVEDDEEGQVRREHLEIAPSRPLGLLFRTRNAADADRGRDAIGHEFVGTVLDAGDVNARVWIRIREVEQSLSLLDQILSRLPDGKIQAPVESNGKICEGLGLVEAFRGDVLIWLRLDGQGRVERGHLRDASWFQWPLLETAVEGNIVADFPLCNKSFNCSYSGHDL